MNQSIEFCIKKVLNTVILHTGLLHRAVTPTVPDVFYIKLTFTVSITLHGGNVLHLKKVD